MSLINDMLRDLDKRGGRSPQDAEAGEGSAGRERLTGNMGGGNRALSSWLPALAAFVLVAGIVLWEQGVLSEPNRPESEQALASDTGKETQEGVAPGQAKLSGSDEAHELILVPNFYPELMAAMKPPEETTEQDHSSRIKQLMLDADRALERDRLTSPIEDNAYGRYQKVLDLAPEHAGARRGMARIARRYLDLAENYIERGNALRAEVLLRRAQTVQAQHPDIPAVSDRLAILVARDRTATSTRRQNPSTSEQASVTQEETPSQGQGMTEPPNGRLEVKPNADSLDRQAVQEAKQLIAQGREHSARLRLQSVLEEFPSSPGSAALLAKLYLDQGALNSARQLLADSEVVPLDQRTHLQAQIFLAEGRSEEAIAALEQHLDQATANESYRAMLAGLYYRASRHIEAANHYRRLLENFGAKPAYWLGLGLALDAQNSLPSALEAYRRAQASGYYETEEQAEVGDYIEQRIATLEGQGN